MKTYRDRDPFTVFSCLYTAIILILMAGCQSPRASMSHKDDASVRRIRISAITEFVPDPNVPNQLQIKTLIELFNVHGFSIKSPCTLRFEFYEFRSASSDPRGQRLLIWPNRDLSDSVINDKHWKNFLRGYEFFLPVDTPLQKGKKYVLEATCQIDQQRFSDLYEMRYQP